ncbi:MAG TPA: type II toxin-antitoxin system PemK/MazF family toxin [Polyangiaceae bacterium]|nr:type II toxin-antitoxin system PemK/MazF family toxin [Polyangiaceae bacterium]
MSSLAPKRGHLYWARMDKRRPVLVMSPDYRNERASDVIIVPGSTRVREAPTHVVLRAGEGGVRARTTLKCEQVTTLPTHDLEARPLGGKLSATRVAAVERALLRAIGVPVPEPE